MLCDSGQGCGQSTCLSCSHPGAQSSRHHKTEHGGPMSGTSALNTVAGCSNVQGHTDPPGEFQARIRYLRLSEGKKKKCDSNISSAETIRISRVLCHSHALTHRYIVQLQCGLFPYMLGSTYNFIHYMLHGQLKSPSRSVCLSITISNQLHQGTLE